MLCSVVYDVWYVARMPPPLPSGVVGPSQRPHKVRTCILLRLTIGATYTTRTVEWYNGKPHGLRMLHEHRYPKQSSPPVQMQ